MSSKELTIIEKKEFVKRFAEVCGTSEPAGIARLLEISYQAARNYLDGRIPEAPILLVIAEKTPYSLHWLLTGRGERFADNTENAEEKLFLEKLRNASKEGCTLAIQEAISGNQEIISGKTIILDNAKVENRKIQTKIFPRRLSRKNNLRIRQIK